MLIRAYGEFWNPEAVYWGEAGAGKRGKLPGRVRKGAKSVETDAWEQDAIYALHLDFKVVYVGKGALGKRLRAHLSDRHAGRWDMFSWYGLKIIKADGSLRAAPAKRMLDLATIQASLEALAIGLVDPPLNRRREALKGADPVEQLSATPPRSIRGYLEEILSKVDAQS
jgi:hypothetical protein